VNIDHALCVLSLNIVNDKIFLIEWCWFLFLTVVCFCSVLARLLCLLLPWLRVASLKSTDISYRMEDDKVLRRVVARCHLGDWFLLTLVKRNLDDRQFTSWIKEVEERICEKDTVRRERAKRERNGHSTWARHGVRERKWRAGSGEESEGKEGVLAPRADAEGSQSLGSQSDLASA